MEVKKENKKIGDSKMEDKKNKICSKNFYAEEVFSGEEIRVSRLPNPEKGIWSYIVLTLRKDGKFIQLSSTIQELDQLTEIKNKNMDMIKRAASMARKDGVKRAADLVESMAREMGDSNLLHAVALALHNMDIPE